MAISWISPYKATMVSKVYKSCQLSYKSLQYVFHLGYLIAVEKDGKQVGEFIISGHKAMGCATQNSGITHSNASSKRSVKGKWQIPANLQGSVVEVRVTLVYQYSRAGHQRASIKL